MGLLKEHLVLLYQELGLTQCCLIWAEERLWLTM
jgi:hypothetical protein